MSLRIGAAHAPLIALLLAATVLVLAPRVASADFSVPPVADGLTITTYTGSLDELRVDGEALDLVSAWATVEGEFVGYVFGAPDFVNSAFTAEFAGGLNNQGLIVRAGDTPQRTGDAELDAVIDAVLGEDAAGLAALVEFQTVACTTSPGAGGPPQCEDGDANGTEYNVIPFATCEREWVRDEDLQARLAMILGEIDGLHAVVESSTDTLGSDYPDSEHYVVFHRTVASQELGIRFHVDAEGDVVTIWAGCAASAEDLTMRNGGGQLPYVIGPFDA